MERRRPIKSSTLSAAGPRAEPMPASRRPYARRPPPRSAFGRVGPPRKGEEGVAGCMRKSKPGRRFHALQARSARRRIGSGAASGRFPAPRRSHSGPAPMTQQSASAPSGPPLSAKVPPTSPAARTKLLLEGPVLPTLLAACGAEHPQPPGLRRRDHLRRVLPRPHRNGCARRRLARVSVGDAGSADHQQRHGRRGLVCRRARARRRTARARRRARLPRLSPGARAWRRSSRP